MRMLFFISALLLFFSCKKEEKIDFENLSAREAFVQMKFDCHEYPSNNYFKGTMDGRSFCRYQGDLDSFECYQASGFVSTEPSISTGATPQYVELYCRFTPRGPRVGGAYELYLLCRDTAFTGNSLGDLIEKTFIEGEKLPLSTQFLDWSSTGFIPPKSAIQGAGVFLNVFLGAPSYTGWLFMSDQMIQEPGRYIKCTRNRKTDKGYEIELDVNLQIPNAMPAYATKRLDMKGIFHFEIPL